MTGTSLHVMDWISDWYSLNAMDWISDMYFNICDGLD